MDSPPDTAEATTAFTAIPILPLSHAASPALKPAFLSSLRAALLNVGFLYISETGIPEALTQDVVAQCRAFFETLPEGEKLRIEMKNEKSFLGYSRVSGTSPLPVPPPATHLPTTSVPSALNPTSSTTR